MLIVPELQVTFILPPRTGSDSLCVELMSKFPNAFLPYRHMEADGLPAGYETWRRVGFVRHPLARLWSLFKYCASMDDIDVHPTMAAEVARVVQSVQGKSFEQWVLTNNELFLPDGTIPILKQLHHIPETRKSQWLYLRPDLGTIVMRFQDLPKHLEAWGLDHTRRNGATRPKGSPDALMTKKLKKHMEKHFSWEMGLGLEAL